MARIRPYRYQHQFEYYYEYFSDEFCLFLFMLMCFTVLVGWWATSVLHMTRVVDSIDAQNALLAQNRMYGWEELANSLRAEQFAKDFVTLSKEVGRRRIQ